VEKSRHSPQQASPAADAGSRHSPGGAARGARDDGPGARSRARESQAPKFCWQCRKPLHARSDRCPFCGEAQ
jgi:hypothetical protein